MHFLLDVLCLFFTRPRFTRLPPRRVDYIFFLRVHIIQRIDLPLCIFPKAAEKTNQVFMGDNFRSRCRGGVRPSLGSHKSLRIPATSPRGPILAQLSALSYYFARSQKRLTWFSRVTFPDQGEEAVQSHL